MQSKNLILSFSSLIGAFAFFRLMGVELPSGVILGFTIIALHLIVDDLIGLIISTLPLKHQKNIFVEFINGIFTVSSLPVAVGFGIAFNNDPVALKFIDGLSLLALSITIFIISQKSYFQDQQTQK
ncbi:hypothetical protein SA286_14670 [Bacillus altitudinis]|uniref:hypothetical protein n=1 Tax=Bacillus altitudinis TaxID=293387 RepID=UPI002D79F3B3|nr:hypothetical protein [Bacillus altitudinis]WRO25160.1 hypothetical protein SA286_14670 [Bacillus altitudinis]